MLFQRLDFYGLITQQLTSLRASRSDIFMVNLILKFVSISRAAGLRVSTSEVLDCLHQLELIDMTDEPQFAAVLRANFAKSRREQFHFDRLYELFFHELRQESNIAHADPLARQIQRTLQELAPQHNENDASQAVLDFLAGDPLPFLERMQLGFLAGDGNGGGPGSNLGPMVQRLELMLQINAVEDSLAQFLIDQHDRMHWENRRDLKELFKARLDSARRLLTRQPQPFDDDNQITTSYQQHLDRLGGRMAGAMPLKTRAPWTLRKHCAERPLIRVFPSSFFFVTGRRAKPKSLPFVMYPVQSGRRPDSC